MTLFTFFSQFDRDSSLVKLSDGACIGHSDFLIETVQSERRRMHVALNAKGKLNLEW